MPHIKGAIVKNWNVVVTVFDQQGYRRARSLLSQFGDVGQTEFYNVLVIKVPDVSTFTRDIADLVDRDISILNDISRIMPAHAVFNFQDTEQFEQQARAAVLGWAKEFIGRAFYVRLHRRGLRSSIRSSVEERFLDDALLTELKKQGSPGRIDFEAPDMVIDIETVGHRAGISRWSREDLRRLPFLCID